MFKYFVILYVLINYSNGQECTPANLRKSDANVAKLMTIGNSGRKFPENKGKDLIQYCRKNAGYVKEIEKFKSKCMKGLPKQVASILVYSLKSSINQLCNKDSRKLTDLIASTKCINTATPEINKCYTALIDNIQGTIQVPDNKKIPHVCCEYYRIFPCITSRAKRIPICTDEHITTAMNFVRSMLGNVMDLLCADYTEGSDKCELLGRPPKKLKSQKRTKSFMIPLLDMFDSFPEV